LATERLPRTRKRGLMAISHDPYSAPLAPVNVRSEKARRHWRDCLNSVGIGFLGALAILGVTWFVVIVVQRDWVGAVGALLACAAAGWGVWHGFGMLRARGPVPTWAVMATVLGTLANFAMMGFGAPIALVSVVGFRRGRQLRQRGRVLLAPVRRSAGWTTLGIDAQVPECLRGPLAAQWRENGRTEHASVAAFARLTLDLMALGAPAELIVAANRDALDEIRHTELCFSLAQSLDGIAESPGPFPEVSAARTLPSQRTLALAKLAVDSLVDGALHEGVSARIIAKLARRCEEPATRAILKEIAADEGRHAAHGWDVVRWCLAEGGRPV